MSRTGLQPLSGGLQPVYNGFTTGLQLVYNRFTSLLTGLQTLSGRLQPVYKFMDRLTTGLRALSGGLPPVYSWFTTGLQPGYDTNNIEAVPTFSSSKTSD